MNEFSDINAETHRNSEDFITALGEYNIVKVLINGDFLAKNEYDDYFLLSKSNGDDHEQTVTDLIQSNVLQAIQMIEQNGEYYKVFPFEKRMQWGGQLNSKGKSEKYCATLLYSVLRRIIKPLSTVKVPIKYEQWINLENLWIKDNAVFLLLRQKYSPDKNNSSQKNSNIRRFYRINSSKFRDNVQLLIKKIGQLFWSIFFKTQQDRQCLGKQKFKVIIAAMRKNEINLEQLQQIMTERKAINALMSSQKKNIGFAQRRALYDTLQINNRKEDNNETSKQKQFAIPVYTGKPMNGLLFAKNRRYQVQTLPNTTIQNEKKKKLTILSSIDSDVPPSFNKNRRFKKMSMFGDSRSKSRGLSFSVKANDDTITRKELNSFKKQRYSISNRNDIAENYSFAADKNKDDKQQSPSVLKNKYYSKKKQVNRYMIDSSLKKDILFPSKIDKFNQKSKQKALKMLHSTLQVDNSSINDSKFISALREKKNQQAKVVPTTFFKSKYQNQKIQNKIYRVLHEEQFKNRKVSFNDDSQRTYYKENKEKKIINQDLYRQKYQENISYKSIKQEELFTEKSEYEQPKHVKLNIPQAKYQVERKTNVGENYHSNKILKSSIQKHEINNTLNIQIKQPFEDKIQKNPQIQQIIQRQKANKIRQSEELKDPFINRQNSFQVELPIIKGAQMVSTIIPREVDTTSLNKIEQKAKSLNKQTKQSYIQEAKLQQAKSGGIKIDEQNKEHFFNKVEKNSFSAIPEADQDYVYVSKINVPKKQQKIDKNESQIMTKSIQKKQKPKVRQAFSSMTDMNDQIQQVSLGFKNNKKIQQPPKSVPPLPISNKNLTEQTKKQPEKHENTTNIKSNTQLKKQVSKTTQVQQEPPSRMKTAQSNASSNGQKTAKKHIDEYIFIVNKMGEAVAKTAKLSKKLQSIEWYTGVYFLYKRFYHQRKKIQRYLQESIPKLTRYGQIPQQQWREWLMKGQREALLAKCKADNVNIQNSIKKMAKKVESKQLPAKVLMNVNVNKNNLESTKIAIQYVIDEYDQAVENKLLKDPQILTHLCEMVNSLYVVAQLDGKIKEKKKIADFMKINRTEDELNLLVQTMFDLYEQQQ